MKQNISVTDLQARLQSGENLQLIDVRSAGEFAAGHVPSATNIPLEQIAGRVGDLGSSPIAVLCQSGHRAGMACEMLQEKFENLLLVQGGTKAWVEAGFTVVRSSSSTWALERQVRLIAGLLILTGTVLSLTLASGWIYLAMFVGAGLTFAGLTDICGMAMLLAKLPWNNSKNVSCSTTGIEA